jgi:mono/diheme cytochrome c family protein
MFRKIGTILVIAVIVLSLVGAGAWLAFHSRVGPGSDASGDGSGMANPNGSLAGTPARSPADELEQRFTTQVRPFLQRYCFSCHGPKKQEAELDLSRDQTIAVVAKNVGHWELVLQRLQAEEMPPAKVARRPGTDERGLVIAWIRDLFDHEARRNAGDPGTVLARRLSNAEFDNTIRDLTGVDVRPTREFPVDPANEAGFDNSGESLTMSPALLKKYLAAARLVADHLVLMPEGFAFAPHPVVTDTDRDKYCVRRIIDFYERHRVDYADYFLAAWRFRHRAALGKPQASLADFAKESRLSARYLETIWSYLEDTRPAPDSLGEVRLRWRKLPGDVQKQNEARHACEDLRELVLGLRRKFTPKPEKLQVKGISQGSQPFVLWRNDWLAARHLRYSGDAKGADAEALAQFCRVFPDVFVVTERAPYYDPSSSPKGRLLSAGFHLMHGYYRDDGPLCELVLDERERRELDALWHELDFITLSPMRQYKDFIFFERAEPPRFMFDAEFDFARSEDRDATSAAKMDRLAKGHLAKARKLGASDEALRAIEAYYRRISADVRRVERARLEAEPSHLEALVRFTERAYRRPLSTTERDDLVAFYRSLRSRDELGHEEALRDTLATVLLSPHFCYRFDLAGPGTGVQPLSDYELASRLSYFLWASMPDAELLAHAAAGDLHRPDVLTAQAQRMLRDPRVRGLATEFAGNWLDFRRFEEHNSVDRDRFPAFTNELRQAMFEEPIRYLVDVAQRNRSVLDLLYGKDTFVNRPLARHYGMPEPLPASPRSSGERARGEGDDWVHVEDARPYGRGGLLPMAVFLTKNAPGLRTSPVKRGYWVVRRVLSERIPPPPPTVPELPKDEASLGELTLPQLLARHRADKTCAACHDRFDSVGLVFEGFGPVGERREKDLGGRPVQTAATFPDGIERNGLEGLRAYLRDKRQDDFINSLCRTLFAYALGRSLLPSDQQALDAMRTRLATDGYAFGSLVDVIVTSPQFLHKRGRDDQREQ